MLASVVGRCSMAIVGVIRWNGRRSSFSLYCCGGGGGGGCSDILYIKHVHIDPKDPISAPTLLQHLDARECSAANNFSPHLALYPLPIYPYSSHVPAMLFKATMHKLIASGGPVPTADRLSLYENSYFKIVLFSLEERGKNKIHPELHLPPSTCLPSLHFIPNRNNHHQHAQAN